MIHLKKLFKKEIKDNQVIKREPKDNNNSKKIASIFGLEYYEGIIPKKLSNYSENSFNSNEGLIYFYPPNDGRPLGDFYFYKDNKILISNNKAFSEIENIDEILLKMVKMYEKSLDSDLCINPYGFMLRLKGDLKNDFKGKAELVVTKNSSIDDSDDKTKRFFMNRFIDHFIGWNFGAPVKKSKELETELKRLNKKLIRRGIREYAGAGLDVRGSEYYENKCVQQYFLPVEEERKYIR